MADSDRPCDQALSPFFFFFFGFFLGLESACDGILRRLIFFSSLFKATFYFCVVKGFMTLHPAHPWRRIPSARSLFKSLLNYSHMQRNHRAPGGEGRGAGRGTEYNSQFCSRGSLNLLSKSPFPHPGSCQKGERKLVFGGPEVCWVNRALCSPAAAEIPVQLS